jgi:hypothetical protein
MELTMQERKQLIRIRVQRHPLNAILWAILRQVMTPHANSRRAEFQGLPPKLA